MHYIILVLNTFFVVHQPRPRGRGWLYIGNPDTCFEMKASA